MKLHDLMGRHAARRAAVVLTAAAALTAVAGTSYAYWASTGAGTGSATAADMTIETEALLETDEADSKLYPNGSADAILRVKNPNAFSVQVVDIVSTGPAVATPACATPALSFVAPVSYGASQFEIAANSSVLLHLAGGIAMSPVASNDCQGKAFSLPVTVTVRR